MAKTPAATIATAPTVAATILPVERPRGAGAVATGFGSTGTSVAGAEGTVGGAKPPGDAGGSGGVAPGSGGRQSLPPSVTVWFLLHGWCAAGAYRGVRGPPRGIGRGGVP